MELHISTRLGELCLRQERVLGTGECASIVSALRMQTPCRSSVSSHECMPIDDDTLPCNNHLRGMVARLSGVSELAYQEPWIGVRCGPNAGCTPGPAELVEVGNLPGQRTHGLILYLAGFLDGGGGADFATAGLVVTPEPGIMIAWNVGTPHQVRPVIEPGWLLSTWVRDEPQVPPGDEITVRTTIPKRP